MAPQSSSQNDINSPSSRGTFTGPVILATDGSSASRSQAITASLIAEQLGVPLIVTTVLPSQLVYYVASGISSSPIELNSVLLDTQRADVKAYIEDALGPDRKWEPDIRTGGIARGVVESARDHNASLIVVGAGEIEKDLSRVRGGRALQILHQSPYPVLAVRSELSGLPHRALAATDFGVPSLYAAQVALDCLADPAEMTLLHVAPLYPAFGEEGRETVQEQTEMLNRARSLLRPSVTTNAQIDTKVEGGRTTEVIISEANKVNADLIAIGTHRPGFVERFFVGSVVSDVLHFAPVSVLVAPRPSKPEAVRISAAMEETPDVKAEEDWSFILNRFSERNTGRRVSLEVDELAIGGQVQVSGYLLEGVTYDPKDRRVDVMLSQSSRTGSTGNRSSAPASSPHLTRMIEDVQSIAVRGNEERDSVLEIVHEGGYTLLYIDSQR